VDRFSGFSGSGYFFNEFNDGKMTKISILNDRKQGIIFRNE